MKTLIGVIGTSQADTSQYSAAEQVGGLIAKRGGIVICGGMGGVMEAASKGAVSHGGLVVGVLPQDRQQANKFIDIPIVTGFGEGRNVILVKSSQVIIAIGGGFGTLSEISFALRLDIPIIGLNTWNVSEQIRNANTPEEAVDMAFSFIAGSHDSGLRL